MTKEIKKEILFKDFVVSNPVELKRLLKSNNLIGLSLDIDETLSYTIQYWHEQLSIKFGNPENLSVEETFQKYGYFQNVPYWKTPDALYWMDQARLSNELQAELPLIENSNHVVQEINTHIPILLYLTNRPVSVVEGTIRWLKKNAFVPAAIIARPDGVPVEDGNKWKAGNLELLYPQIQGIVDDHPGLVEKLPPDYKGTVYLFDRTESPQTKINVVPCKTWNDVLNAIKK